MKSPDAGINLRRRVTFLLGILLSWNVCAIADSSGATQGSVVTDAHGVFSITGLPAGKYIACAEVSTPGLLDPCHWATSAPGVTINAGQTTTPVTITMARGAVVHVHIDDPEKILPSATGAPFDFSLQVHVITSKGIHYSMPIQSSNSAGRDHAIAIPFGAPVTLSLISPHFRASISSNQLQSDWLEVITC